MATDRRDMRPPRLASWLLEKFAVPAFREELRGDLDELFSHWIADYGVAQARRRYTWSVIRLMRPFRRTAKSNTGVNFGMLQNHFKIAVRNMRKQWQYSAINIAGLAMGMTTTLFILLYVRDERSFDRFHQDADQIYRVTRDVLNSSGQLERSASMARGMSTTLRIDLPETEASVALMPNRELLVVSGARQFYESRVFRTDSNFFKVFTFPLVRGESRTALSDPKAMIMTESTARKYFGSDDPVGKFVSIENQGEFTVAAIAKDVPPNAHFHFDILIPLQATDAELYTNWDGGPHYHTYLKLRNHTTITEVEKRLAALAKKYRPGKLEHYGVQPIVSIHLQPALAGQLEPGGDEATLNIFVSIAAFVMLIAAINYINLATARATRRAKEVGIRKTAGAWKGSLILQFLTESTCITMLSFLGAVVLAAVCWSPFELLTNKQIELSILPLPALVLWIVSLVVGIGVIAGIYPAIYISSFNPAEVLKGNAITGKNSSGVLRKALVALQFSISTSLIIGTIIVTRQLEFIHTANLGFNKNQVVVVPNAGRLKNRSVLEHELEQIPGVVTIGASTSIIGQPQWTGNLRENRSSPEQMINFCQINYTYLAALGIELTMGRNFSRVFPSDTMEAVILNATAVRHLGLKDPVGTRLIWGDYRDTTLYATVVGVVADFHITSFHDPIKPYAFLIRNNFFVQEDFTSRLFIKVSGDSFGRSVTDIEAVWKKFVPQRPFSYYFLDDTFHQLHRAEERFRSLFVALATLALFITVLGLYALISFVVEQRTKEIGIRKILGAPLWKIIGLIYSEIFVLNIIGLAAASLLAGYFMTRWLETFAYRISLQWWMFIFAGLTASAVVLLATGYQSIKAARANPVNSLRSE